MTRSPATTPQVKREHANTPRIKGERTSPRPATVQEVPNEDGPEVPREEPVQSSLYGLTLNDVADFDLAKIPGPFGIPGERSAIYVVWKGRRPGLYHHW